MSIHSQPATQHATSGLAGAIQRGHGARRAWVQDGTLLSATAYATCRGVSSAELPEAEARGELFALDIDGARWYPSELLKLSTSDAAVLCRALSGDDEASKLVFLMRTHGALAGRTPAAAIAQGQLALVLQLASAWRES